MDDTKRILFFIAPSTAKSDVACPSPEPMHGAFDDMILAKADVGVKMPTSA